MVARNCKAGHCDMIMDRDGLKAGNGVDRETAKCIDQYFNLEHIERSIGGVWDERGGDYTLAGLIHHYLKNECLDQGKSLVKMVDFRTTEYVPPCVSLVKEYGHTREVEQVYPKHLSLYVKELALWRSSPYGGENDPPGGRGRLDPPPNYFTTDGIGLAIPSFVEGAEDVEESQDSQVQGASIMPAARPF